MGANQPFIGLYSVAMRGALRSMTGQETKVFLALVAHCDAQGKCWPGLRELAALTEYPAPIVGELILSLQAKGFVKILRHNERDPFTGRLQPDIYAVNDEVLLCSDTMPAFKHAYTYTHSSMPVNSPRENSAQADRITEADTEKQNHSEAESNDSIVTKNLSHQNSAIANSAHADAVNPFNTAATLKNANAPTQGRAQTTATRQRAQTNPAQTSANAPNNARSANPSPGSGRPPPQITRDLTFSESVIANAVRQQVRDMSAETARNLIARFGSEQVSAAVSSFIDRNKKQPIAKPTGWIIRNLEAGARTR